MHLSRFTSLKTAIEIYLDAGRIGGHSVNTTRSHKSRLDCFRNLVGDNQPVAQALTLENASRYLSWLDSKNYKRNTRYNHLVSLKGFWAWVHENSGTEIPCPFTLLRHPPQPPGPGTDPPVEHRAIGRRRRDRCTPIPSRASRCAGPPST